jgi:hypothetical protein
VALDRGPPAVELVANPAIARLDIESEAAGRAGNERRDRATVRGQWRDGDALGARRQQRPARGHRVGARAEGSAHHQAIARQARVQDVVEVDRHEQLARPVADDHEVVDRNAAASGPADLEGGDQDRRPATFRHLFERPVSVGGLDHGESADASAGHAHHGP